VIPIFINQGLQNNDITIDGDGKQTRSFIFVSDVAEATYIGSQLKDGSDQILNLSGTDSIAVCDLAHLIKNSIPESTSNIVHRDARQGDVKDSIGSMERTSAALRFSPTIPFETGLEHTVSWYRSAMTK
jgi:nucleoside-diphosphate-sugar epimerase